MTGLAQPSACCCFRRPQVKSVTFADAATRYTTQHPSSNLVTPRASGVQEAWMGHHCAGGVTEEGAGNQVVYRHQFWCSVGTPTACQVGYAQITRVWAQYPVLVQCWHTHHVTSGVHVILRYGNSIQQVRCACKPATAPITSPWHPTTEGLPNPQMEHARHRHADPQPINKCCAEQQTVHLAIHTVHTTTGSHNGVCA